MKSLPTFSVAAVAARGVRFLQRSAFGGVVLASLLAAVGVQGQGLYYPVNPQGPPYGTTYTTITVHSNPNLQALQTAVQTLYGPTVTLAVPIPTGDTAPTTAQYSAAVQAVIQGSLATPGNFPAGVTTATLAAEAVAWRSSDYPATTTAIAQTIIAFNNTNAVSNLTPVIDTLAKAQPTLIDGIMSNILTQAATVNVVAQGIPLLVKTSIADIPTDQARISSIINYGLSAIMSSVLPAATGDQTLPHAPNKQDAFIGAGTGLVPTLLDAPTANGSLVTIDTILKSVTGSGALSLAPAFGGNSSLNQILDSAVTALQLTSAWTAVGANQNVLIGALNIGTLRSQGASAAAIAARLATDSAGTATYTNAVAYGYTHSANLAAYDAAVQANPGYADAVASGASIVGGVGVGQIVQYGLLHESGTPNTPRSLVAALIGANQTSAVSIVLGAINTSTSPVTVDSITTPARTPYGSATAGDLAWAAADASPIQNIGSAIQNIVAYTTVSTSSLNTATVTSIVQQAIAGAIAGGKTGAFADIVYKEQSVARSTAAVSDPLVRAAIDAMGPASSYIAVVAALAGDSGSNRAAIQNAAYAAGATSEIQLTGGDVTAASSGGALVQSIQTNVGQFFTSALAAYYSSANGASPTNAAIADVYAAVLTDPLEADAGLAAAIKQSGVPDATLTMAADNAYRVTNGNSSLAPNLAMVDAVVTHIKSEALSGAGIQDLFDFVGHQIILNPTLTNDIATAATVVDPDNAHFIAHSVAFNATTATNPTGATSSIASIFKYAQIVNPTPYLVPSISNPTGAPAGSKSFPGPSVKGKILDQPAAAAAITAGLVTGILEANLDKTQLTQSTTTSSVPLTTSALTSAVAAAVANSITATSATYLRGMTFPFNNTGDTAKQFVQSDGTASGAPNLNTTTFGTRSEQTFGAAGAITGYIAQVTTLNDSTISPVTAAVLTASVGGNARLFALEIAQAAGQALRWVGGINVSTALSGALSAGNPAFDIASAMAPTEVGYANLAQLENAVAFGINQAAAGVIGAGALGLNATGLNPGTGTLNIKATGNANSDFYQVRSATGTPVTDIFNL